MTRTNPYQRCRTLVLGASGFIGPHVARALHARGAEVLLVVRDRERAASVCSRFDLDGQIFQADLGEPYTIERLIRDLQPDMVFNLAGYGVDSAERDPTFAFEINE